MQLTFTKTAFIALAAVLLAGCSKPAEEEAAEGAAPVQVAAAKRETIRRLVEAAAVVYPVDQANVMPKVSAAVQKFYINRGDHVNQGQLLATLENHDLVAALAESKGQLAEAEANLLGTSGAAVPEAVVKAQTDVQAAQQQYDAAQKLLESRQGLFKQGVLARRQVDEAQVAFAQAKAQLDANQEHLRGMQGAGKESQLGVAQAQADAARAHLAAAEAQLAYTEIHSPIMGVISDRPQYAGEMASPSTPLFTVMDISRIVARASLPQEQASQVKVGNAAMITFPGGDEPITGKVTVVSPAADPASTTIQVWVEAANPDEALKPGMSVHVAIVAAQIPNAIVVPAAAILPAEEGGTAVAVVDSSSTVHLKQVTTGARDGERIQILEGAAAGDNVVVVGGIGLDDGAKVQITPGEESSDKGEADDKGAAKGKANSKAKAEDDEEDDQ